MEETAKLKKSIDDKNVKLIFFISKVSVKNLASDAIWLEFFIEFRSLCLKEIIYYFTTKRPRLALIKLASKSMLRRWRI